MTKKEKIRKYRKEFRQYLIDRGGTQSFSKQEYIRRIRYTLKNLKKYHDQFPVWFAVYWNDSNKLIRLWFLWLIGKEKAKALKENKMLLTFNDIYKIFKWMPLKRLFKDYLCAKTRFSYGFRKPEPIEIEKVKYIENKNYTKSERKELFESIATSNKNKFAEFVYILLCEYIVLHNYMWVSKLKPKEIKTIDKFMKNI